MAKGICRGWNKRDILSPYERYEMNKEFKNRVKNPFKRGDRVEVLRATGKPLKNGVYHCCTWGANGELTCYIRLDEAPQRLAPYYFPRSLRHEQKVEQKAEQTSLAIYQPPCTAIMLYEPKPSNIIRFEQKVLQNVSEGIAA